MKIPKIINYINSESNQGAMLGIIFGIVTAVIIFELIKKVIS